MPAFTKAVTRLSDQAAPMSDEIWDEAARHDNDQALAALGSALAQSNVWNRVNATARQVAGQAW